MEDKKIKILIDLGVKYTKIGLAGEAEPRKILPMPKLFNNQEFFEDKKSSVNMLYYLKNYLEIKLAIEEFASDLIINNVLQVRKNTRDKNLKCFFLIENDLKKEIKEIFLAFIKYIYITFPCVLSFIVIPKNICPIFVSSFCSGLILNCGYLYSTVTVVDNGISIYSKQVSIGSCDIQKYLYNLIINDEKGIEEIEDKDSFKKNLAKYIEDILARVNYIMSRKVSEEYKKLPIDDPKTRGKESYVNIYFYKDLPTFKLSFNSRVILGEKLFGENSENNLAYIILSTLLNKVPCEIRKKISSNIILCGGLTMMNGFYQRMMDELNYNIEKKEFDKLMSIKDDINIHKIIFPRNCLSWIGASLLLNYDNLNFNGREINRKETDIINKDTVDVELKSLIDGTKS